jgi:hemerythrin HHE cation binding domain-containing protein
MDPFELLKKDHQKVSTLFQEIESASGEAKLAIFRKLKQELDVHAHIEEIIFYPALEREKETREITLEAYEEHRVVKDLLSQLDAASSADEDWEARLTVLKENVEHHVDEEEGELFDKANDVLTGEQADDLGDRMQAEKNRQMGYSPDQARRAKAPQESGIIRRVVKAIGAGVAAARETRRTGAKKATTKKAATKKGTAKKAAAKKSTAKAGRKAAGKTTKKSATKRSGASKGRKAATKRTGKSGGSKSTKRTAKKR